MHGKGQPFGAACCCHPAVPQVHNHSPDTEVGHCMGHCDPNGRELGNTEAKGEMWCIVIRVPLYANTGMQRTSELVR